MSVVAYTRIMRCLDIIEAELDRIAAEVGHVPFSVFMSQTRQG